MAVVISEMPFISAVGGYDDWLARSWENHLGY